MESFETNEALLKTLEERGADYEGIGHGPWGDPLVRAEAGGQKEPAVVITAGSHATEQAGVRAAVELATDLDTNHRTVVVPTRDPTGLNGYRYALSSALGGQVEAPSFREMEALLRAEGEILFEAGVTILALVGDTGFALRPPEEGRSSQFLLLKELKALGETDPEVLDPLRGRRLYLPPGQRDIEGSGDFERGYTLVVSPEGDVLHLNRFFERRWGPVETRCVRRIIDDVDPGLFFDLHETQLTGERFHLGVRNKQTASEERRQREVGKALLNAVRNAGAELITDRETDELAAVVGRDPDGDYERDLYERIDEGFYKVHHTLKGEGLNATEYAAENAGLSYVTETGMTAQFDHRVDVAISGVKAGIERFAKDF